MGMKSKQKRAGVKSSTRGLHGVMRNLREEKITAQRNQVKNKRATRVAAARGMEAPSEMQVLTKSAQRRQKVFAKQERSSPAQRGDEDEAPGDPNALVVANSGRQRSFHKELDRVIAMSDILLEVLDARDPMGCRCAALETAVLEFRNPKRIVIVLNKADLVPPENLDAWVRYLRRFQPVVAFKATDMGARRRAPAHAAPTLPPSAILADLTAPAAAKSYGTVQSVDDLVQLLKSYSRSDKLLTAITVGVVGYPNVGKSSVINALKRAKAVTTGAMPGVTRSLQVVALDRKIKLVDCPGVVFTKPRTSDEAAEMVLRSALKVDTPLEPTLLVDALLRRCERADISAHFSIGDFDDAGELLALIAMKRGLLRKGGTVDQASAARVLVQEWTTGAIAYHTQPPKNTDVADDGAAIVRELAPAFSVERLDAPPRVEKIGTKAAKRERDEEEHVAAVQAAVGRGDDAEDDDDDASSEPSELAGTMEDDVAQSALLAALRKGSRRQVSDEPTDPNTIRKEAAAARKKVRPLARAPAPTSAPLAAPLWRRAASNARPPSPALAPRAATSRASRALSTTCRSRNDNCRRSVARRRRARSHSARAPSGSQTSRSTMRPRCNDLVDRSRSVTTNTLANWGTCIGLATDIGAHASD
jgi:nuclear GTP-binding protein